jgi:large subunit ribosomal protein L3
MGKTSRPRRGSRAFWPRKRAEREYGRIKAWPSQEPEKPKIQGFAGYKAGMTHAHIVDYRPSSTTSGQEVLMPVTVVEVPPMRVAAVRAYKQTPYGLKTITEVWADKLDKELARRVNIPKKPQTEGWAKITEDATSDLRVLMHTKPTGLAPIEKDVPELMEYRIGGGDIKARIEYAKSILGKDIDVADVLADGAMTDVIGVTKGYGFESRVVRFGTKLLSHKNSKHRRMIGTQGAWHPNFIRKDVPSDGQRGFQQRTEYNKRILKVGDNGEEVTPRGGFPHYGVVRSKYILFHGSLPGPAKRLLRFRDAVRYAAGVKVEKAQISYVSTESKQGA